MKFTVIILLTTLFSSISTYGQEAASARYFDERARGDQAASEARIAFHTSVCEAALEAFCPDSRWKPSSKKTCFEKQKECGSPQTTVEKRFISKYGVGINSANRDVLPTIRRIFKVLNDIDKNRAAGGNGVTSAVQKRMSFISKTTALTPSEVEENFIRFVDQFFPKKLTTIAIDYWGYFQQSNPGRAKFDLDAKKLTLNFRWCSQQYRFVNEEKRMVGDVLSSAIKDPDEISNFVSADEYQNLCDALKAETKITI